MSGSGVLYSIPRWLWEGLLGVIATRHPYQPASMCCPPSPSLTYLQQVRRCLQLTCSSDGVLMEVLMEMLMQHLLLLLLSPLLVHLLLLLLLFLVVVVASPQKPQ